MTNILEVISFKETLFQSDYAGKLYEEILNKKSVSFTNLLMDEVEEVYTHIVKQYDSLTDFQISVLERIIDQFSNIKKLIDPNRLKDFKYSLNIDGDMLLFRENENGLINIIIHSEDDFAFSFIGNTQGRELNFYDLSNADFERIVLKFFA